MRCIILAAALACLAAPNICEAQVLVTAHYKCQDARLIEIRAYNDSVFIPVAQELVNEGKLSSAGTAYHSWGDEWNVVYYYTAADTPSYLNAFAELLARAGERDRDRGRQIANWCSEHKDNIYTRGRVTTPASETRPAER